MDTTMNFQSILETILSLSLEQRLMIMQTIVNSLKTDILHEKEEKKETYWDDDVPEHMHKELDSRLELMDSGKAEFSTWSDARERIRENLAKKN